MAVWRQSPLAAVHRRGPGVLRGPLAAGDDRHRERPVLRGRARGAPRGRGRQPGQEHLPRRDEPRDPHADERDHRHERPAPRHVPRRGAARLRRDHQDLRRRAADRHQRHPRLLQDRGRQGGAGARSRWSCAGSSRGRSTCSPPVAASKDVELLYAVEPDLPAGILGDAGPAPPDRDQPAVERAQVHGRRARSSCGWAASRSRAGVGPGHGAGRSRSRSATPASGSRPRGWIACSGRSARSTCRSRADTAGRGWGSRSAAAWPS